jgi:hypothetical protein
MHIFMTVPISMDVPKIHRPFFYFIGLIFAVLSFKVNEFEYQRLPDRAVGCGNV